MKAEKIGVRPCAVLIENKKVLVIHCNYGEEFYLFPGGGVEPGETIEECVIRETYEETGIKTKILRLIYVNDYIEDRKTNKRVLNLFFLAKRIGGRIQQGEKDKGKVKKVEWIDLDNFSEIDFRPEYISKNLRKDYKEGFPKVPYFIS